METARGEGKARLLVIEDNPADVELLRRALADAGLDCQLTVVADGADALALFRPGATLAVHPATDLAIVDLNLPKHGGMEIIEQMRANPKYAQLPVVILSSSSAPRDRATIDRFQVRRYIVKPSDLDEFMKIGWQIRELLEAREQPSQK